MYISFLKKKLLKPLVNGECNNRLFNRRIKQFLFVTVGESAFKEKWQKPLAHKKCAFVGYAQSMLRAPYQRRSVVGVIIHYYHRHVVIDHVAQKHCTSERIMR